MRASIYLILLAVIAVVFVKIFVPHNDSSATYFTGNMRITSPAFQSRQYIPDIYGCRGENIHPPLSFSRTPDTAGSLALVMQDPDAPVFGAYVHWLVYNIPPGTYGIAANWPPTGIQAKNTAGQAGYSGPCPQSGIHHYHFILYALDQTLDSSFVSDKASFDEAIKGHVIEQAELVGLFAN